MPRKRKICLWQGCVLTAADGYYCEKHLRGVPKPPLPPKPLYTVSVPSFDAETYFWPKVAKASGCWLWQGAVDGAGYGKIKIRGGYYRASRIAYALSCGDPGPNMVLHICDNRRCVNPKHLYLGNVRRNSQDMRERGRGANRYGEFGWAWK